MFVIELTYKVERSIVEQHLLNHRAWLDDMYQLNYLLCSGMNTLKNGGVIIAMPSLTKQKIEELIKADPFYIHQVADYKLLEFVPTKFNQSLHELFN